MKVVLGLLVALLTLSGCNGYAEYFKEAGYGLNNENVQYRAEPARLVRGSGMSAQEIAQDRWKMWEQGFGVIGTAAFNGSTMGTESSLAIDQANKVGAAVVVLYSQYEGTRTGTTTTTMPVSSTTIAPSGAMYTTTTYLPQTSSYSVDRYEFLAVYFARMKDMGFGVSTSEPTGPEQQAFGTNKGIVVRAVRRGSSAYDAEILPGDLILRFDGVFVAQDQATRRLLDAARGRTVTLTILRPSKGEISKQVAVRAG